MAAFKPQFTSEFNEFEAPDAGHQKSAKIARIVESVRLALTALALLSALSILGTSGDTLSVFNTTHLGEDFLLPLWPTDFDLRPTIALVACSAVVVVTSALALGVSKVPAVRNNALINSSILLLGPTICLVAALVSTSFFYGVNSSTTTSSLHSWSCQWSAVEMTIKPHWGTLCKESKAALYLMIMLIPLELLIFGTVAVSMFVAKKQVIVHERKGSPAMS